MPVGKIEPFDLHTKQWNAYVRRVKQFLLCNEIKENLKVAILITLVGEPTYNLMCDLCAPANPEDKTFTELEKIVADHLEPQRSVIAERHVFRLRRQSIGESLSGYLQKIKHLATTCNFGSMLEENLRDQFVSGLSSDDMRSRLFAEKDITYKKAVELALALEAADKHAEASATHGGAGGRDSGAGTSAGAGGVWARGGGGGGGGADTDRPTDGLHAVRSARPAGSAAAATCWRCGKPHRADKCRFKNYSCDKCQRKGHLKVMCKTSENKRHNFIEDESDSDLYNIRVMSSGDNPYFVDLTDTEPVYMRARPVPRALRAAVERELNRLQKESSIYSVEHSDYGTPIVPVIKQSGEIRICGDYKTTINPKLKRDHYPLPRIEELFAALSEGEEYSKIDLTTAYMQVPLEEDSQAVTAISTHLGTFVFRRTPYGLSCVPEKFQKIMEETLRGLPNTVVFLDVICVTGPDRYSHIQNLRAVIKRLAEMGLTIKINKCSFLQTSVSYLGFVIDKKGLHPDLSKVEAILKAPQPDDVTQLKPFLGLINYYGKFIPNLSSFLHPLYQLLKKNSPWNWNKTCEKTFQEVKQFLSSDKVLIHYNASLPLLLTVDSSSYGLGAVLAHRYPDGTERPISCASRTLTNAEKNYSQLDKEALAILYGVQKHHQFLYGRSFVLKTDHKPLTYIFGSKGGIPQTAASRLQRWSIKLAAYDFEVEYVSSRNNSNADALSRLPLQGELGLKVSNKTNTIGKNNESHYLNLINETLPVNYKDIAVATKYDSLLSKIYGYIMYGWTNVTLTKFEKPFYNRRTELYVEHGCILYKYRVVIPSKLQQQILSEIHEGHLGVIKMKSIARNYVYWPGIDLDIERVGRECEACRNVRDAPPRSSLHPWEFPAAPWQRLHADFAQLNGKYYIVVVDANSKWLDATLLRSTSASDTIQYFRNLFSIFGLPLQLVTDNGPPFQSHEFNDFCRKNTIRHSTSSPYRPQGNGAAENSVKTIKKALKKAIYEGKDLALALSRFLFQYRNCEHATTGVAPAVALLGRRLRTRLDVVRPNTSDIVRQAQDKQILNAGGVDRTFEVGDSVLARDYSSQGDKWTEGRITSKTGPVSYTVQLNTGNSCRRHSDQLWPLTRNRFSMSGSNSNEISDSTNNQSFDNDIQQTQQKRNSSHSPIIGENEKREEKGNISTNVKSLEFEQQPPLDQGSDRARRAHERELRKQGMEI
ncbi:uncharacterized protein K02A2.6-like [Galleria mellonella]|uniref:RNA-directed DNA polymerase n=1 Tax=Galleria mellonella TaxID=7137 RepID=A0ABM3MK68_GALME|nr:uncharacterized protein K02A2.6-like [Galleria mellonella]